MLDNKANAVNAIGANLHMVDALVPRAIVSCKYYVKRNGMILLVLKELNTKCLLHMVALGAFVVVNHICRC